MVGSFPAPGPALHWTRQGSSEGVGVVMDELIFIGNVVNGIGKHVELVVPGRDEISCAPADWPERLCPGSLNLLVSVYPLQFAVRRIAETTKSLDISGFLPAFTIARAAMKNNKLTPLPDMPVRGAAQVWQAMLEANAQTHPCWVLRRFGSGLDKAIELVSEMKLRDKLSLPREKNWPAKVIMRGAWGTPQKTGP
jgi:hypothetical protein